MEQITLYTSHCPKCQVLEKKLQKIGKEYFIVEDEKTINDFCFSSGIQSLPILVVNSLIFDFNKAKSIIYSISRYFNIMR